MTRTLIPEREAERVRDRERYASERDRRIAASARREAEDPEGRAKTNRRAVRAYELRNPERILAKARLRKATRRAQKFGQFVEEIDPQVVFERDEGICGICNGPVDHKSFHIDHIKPLARGGEHSYANVQLAHPSCNCRKGAKEEV